MMGRFRWARLLIHFTKSLCFLVLCVLAGGVSAGESEKMPSREWGTMALYWPATPTHDVVLMFSGARGIEAQDTLAAERVLQQGNAVALVDSSAILRWARADATACLELAAVGQWLSQTMQQRLGLDNFRPAVLVGRGLGGWVVHSLLAQAPEGVFQAGLSVDFVPGNPSARPLCGVNTVAADRHIAPDTRLHGAWAVADTDALSFDAARFARQAAQVSGQRHPWLQVGADYANLVGDFLQWVQSPSPASLTSTKASAAALAGLPVIEYLPQGNTHDAVLENVRVLFFSGDGGWRDIDQQVGRALAEDGLHVLGIDALRYFWRKRTPQSVAADLNVLLEHSVASPNKTASKLVLIGYSFGANILPLVVAELPQAVRERVILSVLLSPELRTDFEIHMAGWLGGQAGVEATPILPAVLAMPSAQVLCVQGFDEGQASLCSQPGLAQAGVEVLKLPGGHHYDKDYAALAARIVLAVRQRHLKAAP